MEKPAAAGKVVCSCAPLVSAVFVHLRARRHVIVTSRLREIDFAGDANAAL